MSFRAALKFSGGERQRSTSDVCSFLTPKLSDQVVTTKRLQNGTSKL